MKVNIWAYVVGFAVILIGMAVFFEKGLGIETGNGDQPGYIFYLLMLISFGVVYLLYNIIENKDRDITKVLRRMASIILYCLATSLMGFVSIFGWLIQSFIERLIELILVYGGGFAAVMLLAVISSKINQTNFNTELRKIMELK